MKKISYFTLICLFAATVTSCLKDEPPVLPETGDSPVKINEAYSNGGRSTYGAIDWVELYNDSDEAVDVSGYILYDKVDKIAKIIVTSNTTIAARAFLLVEVDVTGGFGLGSGGDMVYLEDSNGLLVDRIEFGALTPEQSYARNPDGSDVFKIQTPTPGVSNNGAVAQPSITDLAHTPASPTNDEDVIVTATVTAGEGTLTSVKVQWTLNTTPQTDITMTNAADVYSATIVKQVAGSAIAYSVVATNSAGGTSTVSGTYTVRDATVIDYTGLVINEIDGNGKFIELYNKGTVDIPLAGVTLVKNESATWWTGGAATLAAGEYYTISQSGQTDPGADETTGASGISPKQNLKFQLKDPDDNELDVFFRSNGEALGTIVIPAYDATTPKYAFARCPDGIGAFGLAEPSCDIANPFVPAGAIATDGGTTVKYSDLVINEVDGNGKFVEIHNKGTVPISLENVTIYKNISLANTLWWTGGSTVTIAAGGFYTIAQSGGAAGADEYTGNGGISPKKTVRFDLIAPDASMSIDVFARVKADDNTLDANCTPDYGSAPQYSFSRCPDGTGTFGLAAPSCNSANPATSAGAIETN
ncbi:MAG: lamin tail domain-containing protein [Prevotellaceae bacterium]|jgi:hypothetical protein|nr:lamin tail domain-containing protein [Prevotellaceae bacterium]